MPPPREKYLDENGNVSIMLEDESGRIELTGTRIYREGLVTGCVIGVLGSETTGGQFDVVDICLPEMPPQVNRGDKMGIFYVQSSEINRRRRYAQLSRSCFWTRYIRRHARVVRNTSHGGILDRRTFMFRSIYPSQHGN